MEKLNEILDVFKNEIDSILLLHNTGLVIGGIWALKLHGLQTRETEDLDIILYDPNKKTLNFLESECGEDPEDDEELQYRSYKIEKDGEKIDFLIERNYEIPDFLLIYEYEGTKFYVQSIKEVFLAKSSYCEREKDVNDSISLKRDNFNLINPETIKILTMSITITDCLNKIQLPGRKNTSIIAQTLDECELIDSIGEFINKCGSVRNAITVLDNYHKHSIKPTQEIHDYIPC